MRAFIAISLPKAVKEQLTDLQQPIKGMRWQNAGQYHLTLKFLGEIKENKVARLKQELGEIDRLPFTITLKEFGFFPDKRSPRVVWIGVEKMNSLLNLQHRVEEVCSRLGFKADSHIFVPHVTLARINGAARKDLRSFVNQHKQFQISDVLVKEFVFFKSELHSGGATYFRLKTFILK